MLQSDFVHFYIIRYESPTIGILRAKGEDDCIRATESKSDDDCIL